MSYTDMDIEMKALSMLGSNVPDEDAVAAVVVVAAYKYAPAVHLEAVEHAVGVLQVALCGLAHQSLLERHAC